ncbi:MAG: DMT family protein [Bdellovibrionales bacterium]|nr:DMT family protein [Bdellovibrionales bacterium]
MNSVLSSSNPLFLSILLLFGSNIFMTFAWYGHLKNLRESPLWIAIAVSWGIAFFEYCLQVPANRIGSQTLSLGQLKIVQEIITMVVFAGFSILYMNQSLKLDYLWASLCLIGAVYFVFRGG